MLSGSWDKTLKLWDSATGQVLRTFQGHEGYVASVAFAPDGARVLSGSWDKTLKLWDSATGQVLRTFAGNYNRVISVAFSPEGSHIVSCFENEGGLNDALHVWDVGAPLPKLRAGSAISSVAFSPDGRRVLSGSYGRLEVWDVNTGQELNAHKGETDCVTSVAFSPDGSRVLSKTNIPGTMKLWDVTTGRLLRRGA